MTGMSDDEIQQNLAKQMTTGPEKAAEDKAVEKARAAVADQQGKK